MVTYVSIRLTKCKMQIIWSYEKLELSPPAIVCNFEGIIRSADHQFPRNMQPLDFLIHPFAKYDPSSKRNSNQIFTIREFKNPKIYLFRLRSNFCPFFSDKKINGNFPISPIPKYKHLIFIRMEYKNFRHQSNPIFPLRKFRNTSNKNFAEILSSSDGETRLLYLISG